MSTKIHLCAEVVESGLILWGDFLEREWRHLAMINRWFESAIIMHPARISITHKLRLCASRAVAIFSLWFENFMFQFRTYDSARRSAGAFLCERTRDGDANKEPLLLTISKYSYMRAGREEQALHGTRSLLRVRLASGCVIYATGLVLRAERALGAHWRLVPAASTELQALGKSHRATNWALVFNL